MHSTASHISRCCPGAAAVARGLALVLLISAACSDFSAAVQPHRLTGGRGGAQPAISPRPPAIAHIAHEATSISSPSPIEFADTQAPLRSTAGSSSKGPAVVLRSPAHRRRGPRLAGSAPTAGLALPTPPKAQELPRPQPWLPTRRAMQVRRRLRDAYIRHRVPAVFSMPRRC